VDGQSHLMTTGLCKACSGRPCELEDVLALGKICSDICESRAFVKLNHMTRMRCKFKGSAQTEMQSAEPQASIGLDTSVSSVRKRDLLRFCGSLLQGIKGRSKSPKMRALAVTKIKIGKKA
jgi:hypothetical protein